MKYQKMKITNRVLFFVLILSTSVLFDSCGDDDEQADPEIRYECYDSTDSIELFLVIESIPLYGNDESDLVNYITSSIEINNIAEIDAGEIVLGLIIFNTGSPCLLDVTGSNLPEESLLGHEVIINGMADWTPGRQGEEDRNTYVQISIVITDGEIESVNQV
jgi:hypothetical protein